MKIPQFGLIQPTGTQPPEKQPSQPTPQSTSGAKAAEALAPWLQRNGATFTRAQTKAWTGLTLGSRVPHGRDNGVSAMQAWKDSKLAPNEQGFRADQLARAELFGQGAEAFAARSAGPTARNAGPTARNMTPTARSAVPNGQAVGTTQALDLKGSVGRNSDNRPDDVMAVQQALVTAGHLDPAQATGLIDEATIQAIESFQRAQGLGQIDGKLDVDGATINAINEKIAAGTLAPRDVHLEDTAIQLLSRSHFANHTQHAVALGLEEIMPDLDAYGADTDWKALLAENMQQLPPEDQELLDGVLLDLGPNGKENGYMVSRSDIEGAVDGLIEAQGYDPNDPKTQAFREGAIEYLMDRREQVKANATTTFRAARKEGLQLSYEETQAHLQQYDFHIDIADRRFTPEMSRQIHELANSPDPADREKAKELLAQALFDDEKDWPKVSDGDLNDFLHMLDDAIQRDQFNRNTHDAETSVQSLDISNFQVLTDGRENYFGDFDNPAQSSLAGQLSSWAGYVQKIGLGGQSLDTLQGKSKEEVKAAFEDAKKTGHLDSNFRQVYRSLNINLTILEETARQQLKQEFLAAGGPPDQLEEYLTPERVEARTKQLMTDAVETWIDINASAAHDGVFADWSEAERAQFRDGVVDFLMEQKDLASQEFFYPQPATGKDLETFQSLQAEGVHSDADRVALDQATINWMAQAKADLDAAFEGADMDDPYTQMLYEQHLAEIKAAAYLHWTYTHNKDDAMGDSQDPKAFQRMKQYHEVLQENPGNIMGAYDAVAASMIRETADKVTASAGNEIDQFGQSLESLFTWEGDALEPDWYSWDWDQIEQQAEL